MRDDVSQKSYNANILVGPSSSGGLFHEAKPKHKA